MKPTEPAPYSPSEIAGLLQGADFVEAFFAQMPKGVEPGWFPSALVERRRFLATIAAMAVERDRHFADMEKWRDTASSFSADALRLQRDLDAARGVVEAARALVGSAQFHGVEGEGFLAIHMGDLAALRAAIAIDGKGGA